MKNFKSISIVLLFFCFFIQANAQTKKINISKSKITWIGKKITGEHEGIVKLKEGYFVFKNKKLEGGKFIVDMQSLSNTDQTGSSQAKLEGHLKSEDFFGVAKHPTATLVFKSIADKGKNTYLVNADLKIKGITNPIQFELTIKGNTATSDLVINRTKYDIKYSSGSYFDDLGDKTIYDEFDLKVALVY